MTCPKCATLLRPALWTGEPFCPTCVRVALREQSKAHDDARRTFKKALDRKEIQKPNRCTDCLRWMRKKSRLQGHHPDYSKPLEVIWLCEPCHQERHRKDRQAA